MNERTHYDCEEARAHYHQVRRGDVTIGELDRYDAHLSECEYCQAFVMRMDGMLDAATTVDPAAEADIDRDDLFASIMGAIDDEVDGSSDVSEPDLQVVDEELSIPSSPHRYAAVGMLLAALLVAALGVAMWMERAPDAPLPDSPEIAEGPSNSAEDERPASGETTTDDTPARPQLAELEPIPTERDSVRIHATNSATVRVDRNATTTNVELDDGTMLVEFLPDERKTESLEVSSGDLTIRVVGTIFYVSNRSGSSTVGVVTGKVEVTTDDGKNLFLTDGQEFDSRTGIRTAPEARTEVSRYVDVVAHKEKLASGRSSSETKKVSEERPPRVPEVASDSPQSERSMSVLATTLRDQASEAVRLRQYPDAAQLYEELIVELPSGHPAAMSARLDLSRLYMKQLNQPDRAIPHLKRFIVDRPDDPAAPSARETLCRILEARGESDPACSE